MAEVTEAFVGPWVGTTAPGEDDVTTAMVREAWWDRVTAGGKEEKVPLALAKAVRAVCDGCLREGYYPKAWQRAEVVLLVKPGKKASSMKSLRPIALILAYGWGLERVVAKKVSKVALEKGALLPEQCGGILKRSATDLLASLVHDVKGINRKGRVAGVLTGDVTRAFNVVLP